MVFIKKYAYLLFIIITASQSFAMKRLLEPDLFESNQESDPVTELKNRVIFLITSKVYLDASGASSVLDTLMDQDQNVVNYILELIPPIGETSNNNFIHQRFNNIRQQAIRKTPTYFANEIFGKKEYDFQQEANDTQAEALGEALKVNTTLNTLECYCHSYNPYWSEKGFMYVIQALKVNNTLTKFKTFEVELSEKTILLLAEILASNKTLEMLDIGSTPITNAGICLLVDSVKRNNTLKCLRLFCCSIKDDGFIKIAEIIVDNNTLTELDLGNNDCDVKGSMAIANALLSNRSLQAMDLGTSPIGLTGTMALLSSLRINWTLKKLDLIDIDILDLYVDYSVDYGAIEDIPAAVDEINKQLEINRDLPTLLKDMWQSNPIILMLFLGHTDKNSSISSFPREVVLEIIKNEIDRTIYIAKNPPGRIGEPNTKCNG